MEKEIKDLRNDLISFGLKCATSEAVERMIYKSADDIAVATARSFERLEERIDTMESRIYSRLTELEDGTESARVSLDDNIGDLHERTIALTDALSEIRLIVEGDSEVVIGSK